MPLNEKCHIQYKKENRRYHLLLVYSLMECTLLWFGLRTPFPALVIVVNLLLVLDKAFHVSANVYFYKKQGYYHGHHNDRPEESRWPFAVFLLLDIAAILFCTRNIIVFIVISIVYTLVSIGVLVYTQFEYEKIRNIMDGNGDFPVRIR